MRNREARGRAGVRFPSMNERNPESPEKKKAENAEPTDKSAGEEVVPPEGGAEKPLEEGDTFEKVFLHGRHMGF